MIRRVRVNMFQLYESVFWEQLRAKMSEIVENIAVGFYLPCPR